MIRFMANEEDKEIDVVNPIYEEKEIKNIKSDRVFDDDEFQKYLNVVTLWICLFNWWIYSLFEMMLKVYN